MKQKILFLSKRRPLQRDLYHSPYGRFYYLARELANLGHDVTILLFSYKPNEHESKYENHLHWQSVSLNPNLIGAVLSAQRFTDALKPDWIVGCSDTYYGILAASLAKKCGARYIVDAYDNYAAYIPWALPLHALWFKAIKNADRVTVAGPSLVELIEKRSGRDHVDVITMAPDPDGFFLRDKFRSRFVCGLPISNTLIGYSGSVSRSRGIETLFAAINIARETDPTIQLVLSGRIDADLAIPSDTINLGFLPANLIPVLMNAFDAMAITNKHSAFGMYSYPVKLYEAMACQIPVVATRTPATQWILRNYKNHLVEPDDPNALATQLIQAAKKGRIKYADLPSWQQGAQELDRILNAAN